MNTKNNVKIYTVSLKVYMTELEKKKVKDLARKQHLSMSRFLVLKALTNSL